MSYSLGTYYEAIFRRQLKRGLRNRSEVVRYALRLLDAVERGHGPPGASFTGRQELKAMLTEALDSPSEPMTQAKRKAFYSRAK